MKKYLMLLVTWKDANADEPWKTIEEINPELSTIRTIGYLIKESKESIIIAQSVSDDEMFANRIIIPKTQILKKQKLKIIQQ